MAKLKASVAASVAVCQWQAERSIMDSVRSAEHSTDLDPERLEDTSASIKKRFADAVWPRVDSADANW